MLSVRANCGMTAALVVSCFLFATMCPGTAAGAASIEQERAKLAQQLSDEVYLRLAVGDGRGAARAFAALARTYDQPELVTAAAFAVLDLYENTGLPADIRAKLLSHDTEVRHKATEQLIETLENLVGEHGIPDEFKGTKILGPSDGCPVTSARAFAAGPDGSVLIIWGGVLLYDGVAWQQISPMSIRVRVPTTEVFTDSKGRIWMAGSSPGYPPSTLLQYYLGTVGVCELDAADNAPSRWTLFSPTGVITSFAEGRGAFWLASRTGLFVCDDNEIVPVSCPLPYSPSRKLLGSKDSDGLWVIDVDRVSRFDGIRWSSFKLGDLEPRGGVMVDGQPVILLADGLLLWRDDGFESFPSDERLAAVTAGLDGEIWCVTERGSLVSTDFETWKTHGEATGPVLVDGLWPAVFCDAQGRVWLSRGRGIELSDGAVAAAQDAQPVRRRPLALDAAPLVSSAGSGGWLTDPTPIIVPEEDEEEGDGRQTTTNEAYASDEFGGFPEDESPKPKTPKDLLDELRDSPGSTSRFVELLSALKSQPEEGIRRDAFALAGSEGNPALYSDFDLLDEYAGVLLEEGRPVHACALLLNAWQRAENDEFRKNLRPLVFDALLSAGFGEFARPAFFDTDLEWRLPGDGARPAAAHFDAAAGVQAVTLNLAADIGRDEFVKAGLHRAVILADKRAVLGAMSDFDLWNRLVEDCVAAGDLVAARRYIAITKDLFDWPNGLAEGQGGEAVDSAALAPVRWSAHLKVRTDSGFGPVCGGGDVVCVLEGGGNRRLWIDSTTGAVRHEDLDSGVVARAVLAHPHGAALVVKLKDGRFGTYGHAAGPEGEGVPLTAPIAGLTDSFDGFSATSVKDGVFYCFDGGLTKVDLNAGRVAWRTEAVVGGLRAEQWLLRRALPVADGDDVFAAVGGKLFCLDAASGKVRWAVECGWDGTPAVVGGTVVVGGVRREVWGVDRKNGEKVWTHIGSGRAEGSIISDGKRVFYAAANGHVAALAAATGEFLWRRSTDINLADQAPFVQRPTALLVRGERLAACNEHGYVEFDLNTGAILRRLEVSTARPMASTAAGIVVMTAPDRLVEVADPPTPGLAGRMFDLARDAAGADEAVKAAGIARLVANYVDPADLSAHELALKQTAVGPNGWSLYEALLVRTDLFSPEARRAMRAGVAQLPAEPVREQAACSLFAKSHIERGAVWEAAAALEKLPLARQDIVVLATLLRLQLAANRTDEGVLTAQRLAASGPWGVEQAFRALADAHMEDQALDLARQYVGGENSARLLHMAIGLSCSSGLFEMAGEMLERCSNLMGETTRSGSLACMLTSAGVADRVLKKRAEAIRDGIGRCRELLTERRDKLQQLGESDELNTVQKQLDALEKVRFP